MQLEMVVTVEIQFVAELMILMMIMDYLDDVAVVGTIVYLIGWVNLVLTKNKLVHFLLYYYD